PPATIGDRPPATYPLSLHDALPISLSGVRPTPSPRPAPACRPAGPTPPPRPLAVPLDRPAPARPGPAPASPPATPGSCHPAPERSEEHTSELQSRGHLVCRLLLEKK